MDEFPVPLDPPLNARVVNPTTWPLQPFPLHVLENGVYNRDMLSKMPQLLVAFAAKGPAELAQFAQEHYSFSSVVNASYRNQTLQAPELFPMYKRHLVNVLTLLAAPMLATDEMLDMVSPPPPTQQTTTNGPASTDV